MAKKLVAVRLKKLEYADVPVSGLPSSWTGIPVVHEDTFEYTAPEVSADPYINEITGNPYFHDKTTTGDRAFNFSIGKYDLQQKAVFFGGTYTAAKAATTEPVAPAEPGKWVPPTAKEFIYKSFKATTEDDVVFIFPKALVIANEKNNKKAIGLSIKALAQEPDDPSLSIMMQEDGDVPA
jgi:hypothetical protein